MVRFIGADGGNISNQMVFEPELPQFPGMNQAAPPPVSMIVPDQFGAMFDGTGSAIGEGDEPPDHDDNLAETLDEHYLNKTGKMITEKVSQDISDRKPWMERPFPAHAGLNRPPHPCRGHGRAVPRTRGAEPAMRLAANRFIDRSPHTRG